MNTPEAGSSPQQRQHIISGWLLKAFAARDAGRWALVGFDKQTGAFERHDVRDFLVEVDGHSSEVELEIGRLETPAADAARRLSARSRSLPPGLYAVMPDGPEVHAEGPALSDKGVVGEMRIFVGEHTVTGPSPAERLALARYAGLMYQRAPKTEGAILRWGEATDAAARAEIKRLLPAIDPAISTTLAHRRARMVALARQIGDRLATASWWVVRAAPGEDFVLGDTPVVATLSLGHDDDRWHAILAEDAYTVAMPLGPSVALLMAPQMLMPVTGIDAAGVGPAINRLIWRSADRYVLGRSREHLERALPGTGDEVRRSIVPVVHDQEAIERNATAMARRIVADITFRAQFVRPLEESWQRWSGCKLEFGYLPFPAEDRDFFVPQDRDGPGIAPPCRVVDATLGREGPQSLRLG